ncbi:MAG: glycosyltransferase family 39 protein [Planctomycetota bacterium]|jgi:4-amino-4-deoxy-L-arabinose transferase-like glycosyltransferase
MKLKDAFVRPVLGFNRVAALFLAALILRIISLAILGLPPETFEYETIANHMLAGEGYYHINHGTIYYSQAPPLFAFLCAGIYLVAGHSQLAIVIFQIVCSAIIPVVIYKIARQMAMPSRLSTLAAAIAVIHPGLIVYAVAKLHPLNLDALFISLSVLLVLQLGTFRNFWRFLLTGIVLGLGILTRPTIGLFAMVAMIWLYLQRRLFSNRQMLARLALIIVGIGLVLSPWTIRNAMIHHRFVPISNAVAEVFWRGNNPIASGTAYLEDGRPVFEGAPEAFRRAIYQRGELGQRDLFSAAARKFITQHPFHFLRMTLKKWLYFWWFSGTTGLLYPASWLHIYAGFYFCILLLFVMGLWAFYRLADAATRSKITLLFLIFLSISIAQSLFYVETRHRWAIEPLMGIFIAYGLGLLIPKLHSKNNGCFNHGV